MLYSMIIGGGDSGVPKMGSGLAGVIAGGLVTVVSAGTATPAGLLLAGSGLGILAAGYYAFTRASRPQGDLAKQLVSTAECAANIMPDPACPFF